jgi:cardiolipin synthase
MIIDDDWSIVGTTNLDQRSFGLNDEVNLVCFDETLVSRNLKDFYLDRAQATSVSFKEWQGRPIWERVHEWFGWLLERQQ